MITIFGVKEEKKRQFIMQEVVCELQARVTKDLILLASAFARVASESQLRPGHLHR